MIAIIIVRKRIALFFFVYSLHWRENFSVSIIKAPEISAHEAESRAKKEKRVTFF